MSEPETATGPLAGVRFVELAGGFAVATTGRALADLGAEVTLVMRSSSDRGKVLGFLDGGKRTLSVADEEFPGVAAGVLTGAFGVILDRSADPASERLALGSGAAVVLRFGAEPAGRSAAAVIFHRAGQSMIDTPGGFPVAPPGNLPYYDAAMTGVFAVLATRWSTSDAPVSEPMVVDITAEDVELAHGRPDLTRAAYEGGSKERDPFLALFLRCRDGELAAHVNHSYWSDWVYIIGKPELDADPRFASMADLLDHQAEAVAELEDWCEKHTRDEIERVCQARGVPAGSVLNPGEVASDPQLVHRRFTNESGWPAILPFVLSEGTRWIAQDRSKPDLRLASELSGSAP